MFANLKTRWAEYRDPSLKRPLYAYRYMYALIRVPCVSSLIYDYSWEPGWNKSNHSPLYSEMGSGYRPGFYSFRWMPSGWWRSIHRSVYHPWLILAKIELAGDIVVCKSGYRSEYAKVVGVYKDGLKECYLFACRHLDVPLLRPRW